MSLDDGIIGKRNNDRLFIWVDSGQKNKIKYAAETNGVSISDFVRNAVNKYINIMQTNKSEIQGATNNIRNSVKMAYSSVRKEPEKLYKRMVGYVPENPAYMTYNNGDYQM